MDITSLLNSKSPEPDGVSGSRTIDETLLNSDVKLTSLLPPLHTALHTPLDSIFPRSMLHTIPLPQPQPQQRSAIQPAVSNDQYQHHLLPGQLPLPVMQVPRDIREAYPVAASYSPPQAQMIPEQPVHTSQTPTDDLTNDSNLSKTFTCQTQDCNKSFARRSDLVRHGMQQSVQSVIEHQANYK